MKSNDVFYNALIVKYMSVLSEQHPDLSRTEVEVAALLQMNFKTKDIAQIMGITEKTVENHRINIRRKLKLERHQNLQTTLMSMIKT
jgi:DNA-binding CsgD family transcriptional regulator